MANKELRNNVCGALGIEQDSISDQWEAVPENERPTNPIFLSFIKTFHESTGIERPAEKVCAALVAHSDWLITDGRLRRNVRRSMWRSS